MLPHVRAHCQTKKVVFPARLERAVFALEGRCIIQLCYGNTERSGVFPHERSEYENDRALYHVHAI